MKNWERKSLGDVCEIVNGSTPLRTNKDFWENGNFPWFTIDDIREQGRIITDTKQKVTEAALSKLRVLPVDTVLLCCTASVGEYAITKIELTTNQQFNGLIVKDRKKLAPEFLMHYCSTLKDKLMGLSGKTTIDFIAISKLKNLEIPLPPLPEQQRIVSILDEAFSVIERSRNNAEQNLKNAKELFESYLQGVFGGSTGSPTKRDGWEERKVNEIGNAQTGTTPKTIEKENYGDFIPFIKPADVDFSGIGDIRYDNEGLSEIGLKKGRKMESGSILMVCIGATIGKVGFAEREVSCNQQINSLTVKKEFEPKFIYYAMTSKEFQEKVLLEGKGAQATLPIINKSKWENLTISFPKSKEEQQIIVRQLDALRAETQKLEAVYQKKIDDLEELKKSILQKAFAGELRTEKALIL